MRRLDAALELLFGARHHDVRALFTRVLRFVPFDTAIRTIRRRRQAAALQGASHILGAPGSRRRGESDVHECRRVDIAMCRRLIILPPRIVLALKLLLYMRR